MNVMPKVDCGSINLGFADLAQYRQGGAMVVKAAREAVDGGGGTLPSALPGDLFISEDTLQISAFSRISSGGGHERLYMSGSLARLKMMFSGGELVGDAQGEQVQSGEDVESGIDDSSETADSSGVVTAVDPEQIAREEAMQAEQAQQEKLRLEGIREDFDAQLAEVFSGDEASIERYGKMFDELYELDPEVYEQALVLMTVLGEENPEEFIEGLKFFSNSMRQITSGSGGLDVGGAAGGGFSMEDTVAGMGLSFQAIEVEGRLEFNFSFASVNSEFSGQSMSIREQLEVVLSGEFKDPLVLDMDGDGIELTSAEDGVMFDIDGDGTADKTAFVKGDDALLYLDNNGNGVVDDGRELFGDQEGDANGFAELSRYDLNSDGVIDELDEVYGKLRIWQDRNGDGVNQQEESRSLLEAGVKSIELGYRNLYKEDDAGNILAQEGGFTRTDGSRSKAVDVLLRQYA